MKKSDLIDLLSDCPDDMDILFMSDEGGEYQIGAAQVCDELDVVFLGENIDGLDDSIATMMADLIHDARDPMDEATLAEALEEYGTGDACPIYEPVPDEPSKYAEAM